MIALVTGKLTDEQLDALRAAISRPDGVIQYDDRPVEVNVIGWQPIETAPKDGTAFLGFLPQFGGYFADQRIQRCVWTGWGGGCWDCQFEKGGPGPTHWMPLPEPPKA